jgi:hypothetical protein
MSLPSFYLVCAGPHIVFRSPNCGTQIDIDYQRIFHSSICSVVSHRLVTSLTNTRRSMAARLSAPGTSIQEKLDSVNEYIPHILKLFHSLKNQAPVRLDAGMMFEWKGSFSVNGAPCKFPEIIYEVAMTLHAKAVLHYNLGCYLLSLDLNSNLSSAGQHFLSAAGIMEYLASHLLPQWLSQLQIVRPPETNATICRAMADLFQGEAQQLAVVKAMQKPGGTSNAILTKLCVAVLRIFDQGMDALQIANGINTAIDAHIPYFNRTFYAALSYYYNAEFYRLKEEPEPQTGIALGLFRESKSRIDDLGLIDKKTMTSILQNLSARSPFIRDGVQYLLNNIMQNNAVAEKDNRLIFFQPVPAYNGIYRCMNLSIYKYTYIYMNIYIYIYIYVYIYI